MRAARPHTPRQVRITCTSAKQVCRLKNNIGAGALHLPQSSRAGWSCVARTPPAGAVQSAPWRELDKSSSRAPAESPMLYTVPSALEASLLVRKITH